ncbi:MAG: hypothetical protein MPJ24_06780, partial [Pirellulaceae bacterium]|nr:hypothetical protein [Pirellulaceae bacterium]
PLSSQPSHQELPQDESLRMPDPIDRVSEDPSRLQPSYYAASYQTISPNTLTSETSQGARQEVAANEIEQEDLFDNIDFQTVLPLVEKEHPQAIAVIISQLSPKRGGELLALLPTTLQTEVVRRLADMEEADPAIVQDLCQSITSQLKNYSSSEEELPTGSHILKKIMSSCGNDLQQQILRSLGEEGTTGRALRKEFGSKFPPSMLEPLSTLPFGQGSGDSSMKVARAANSQEIDRQNVPEGRDAAAKVDLTLLKKFSSADLVSLFQQCHTKIALLALVGAEEPLVARVLRQFPRRQQRLFRKQMDTIGSVSLREIQLAQQEVFLLAQKMLGQVEGLQKEASSRKEIIAQKKKQKGNSKGKSELAMAG